jgi:hypothetical protein
MLVKVVSRLFDVFSAAIGVITYTIRASFAGLSGRKVPMPQI